MSIDTSAVLIVGLHFEDLPEDLQKKLEEDSDLYYDEGFQFISPTFDCAISDGYFGEVIVDSSEFQFTIFNKCFTTKTKFKKLLDIDSKFYVIPNIS